MQSKHTWREGVQTCEHVPDDTTQAAADRRRLAFVLAGKADRRRRCLTLAVSFVGKADGNRAKKENMAPKRGSDGVILGPRPR
jgi:hypothetical protein